MRIPMRRSWSSRLLPMTTSTLRIGGSRTCRRIGNPNPLSSHSLPARLKGRNSIDRLRKNRPPNRPKYKKNPKKSSKNPISRNPLIFSIFPTSLQWKRNPPQNRLTSWICPTNLQSSLQSQPGGISSNSLAATTPRARLKARQSPKAFPCSQITTTGCRQETCLLRARSSQVGSRTTISIWASTRPIRPTTWGISVWATSMPLKMTSRSIVVRVSLTS